MANVTPTSGTDPAAAPATPGLRGPFSNALYRALWFAFLASTIGTWIQEVGASWLMTQLTPSKLMVSLVQAAGALPVFLLSVPAGALADIIDRRRLLIFTQSWMLAAAALLGLMTSRGLVDAHFLLFMTFLLNIGAALNGPAWQALTPELVPREQLPAAVTANGVGFNLARAIGPALGGMIVALAGSAAAFLLNAVSFLGVIAVLYRWRRTPRPSLLPTERFISAARAGLRFALHAPVFQAALIRTAAFAVGASALWALLPMVARHDLQVDARGYGLLVGCLGLGAVISAFVITYLRRSLSNDALVAGASVLYAAILVGLALIRSFALACPIMLLAGMAWIAVMSSLNVAAQSAAPGWVKARALSLYLLTFYGCMALGSVLWGYLADQVGTSTSLLLSGGVVLAGIAARIRFHILSAPPPELASAGHWPTHELTAEPDLEDGPVLVTIEYRVVTERIEEFAEAMREWRHVRLRSGALDWGLFSDANQAGRYLEWFLVESWAEHLRQHERITLADKALQEKLWAFHSGGDKPPAEHFVAVR